jgi:hypothetical protein
VCSPSGREPHTTRRGKPPSKPPPRAAKAHLAQPVGPGLARGGFPGLLVVGDSPSVAMPWPPRAPPYERWQSPYTWAGVPWPAARWGRARRAGLLARRGAGYVLRGAYRTRSPRAVREPGQAGMPLGPQGLGRRRSVRDLRRITLPLTPVNSDVDLTQRAPRWHHGYGTKASDPSSSPGGRKEEYAYAPLRGPSELDRPRH